MTHSFKIGSLLFLLLLADTTVQSQNKVRKALFIIADGITPDVLEKVSTPNLNLIIKQGSYLRAHVGGDQDTYTQTPTISAVGYNSLLTGTWVNKHNVWDNDITAPNYNYPTIFRLFKDQYPAKKTAVYSSWLDNRTKLVGDGLAATDKLHIDYHADGYELDTVNFKHDKKSDYMHRIDEKVVAEAAAGIRKDAPDLSWVYLEYTDDMGHMYGDSPEYTRAIELMDKQVGKIWEAIQYREEHFNEEWLIFITTDHGRDEQTGRGHGGQSARQRSTWMVTNAKQLNNYAQYYYPGIVDIMPSIASFMHINFPLNTSREIDGISLLGKVSVAEPGVNFIQGKLDVSWKNMDNEGKIKIWVSPTNTIKEGKPDTYQLLAEVSPGTEHTLVSVAVMPSSFYKVSIEGKYNTINKWMNIAQYRPNPVPALKHKFVVIAHRGDHVTYPENTLKAYQEAIDHEVDYVEIDLRTTKDGQLVSMHNPTVNRMTNGDGAIKDLNLRELQKLHIKSRDSLDHAIYQIPSFEEILKLCKDRIHIYLDFKEADPSAAYQMIKQYGMENQVIVYINSADQYLGWRKVAPKMPLMVSLPDDIKDLSGMKSFVENYHPDVLDGSYKQYTSDMTVYAEKNHLPVWPDGQSEEESPVQWKEAVSKGLKGLQTDHPAAFIKFLKEQNLR